MSTFTDKLSELREAYFHQYIEKDDKVGTMAGSKVKPEYLSSFMYAVDNSTYKQQKIGRLKGLDIYKATHNSKYGSDNIPGHTQTHFILHDPETNTVHIHLAGTVKDDANTMTIGEVASSGKNKVKAHDFYEHLLKRGHVNALVGKGHSEGGIRLWQRLAKKKDISVHGWNNDHPVNLDPQNRDETHSGNKNDPDENEILKTHLVASYHKNLKQKIKQLARETS